MRADRQKGGVGRISGQINPIRILMKFILAKKDKTTQIFAENGEVIPVTVLEAGPVTVTQIKEKTKDGYNAVQVGFGEKRENLISKPERGHMKGLGNFAYLKEFRLTKDTELKVGDKIDASVFALGDKVDVSSISKGKGFQGVVKRHGFHGGPRTHGQKHSEREAGSIGGGLRNRVPKGMRMAGRMGGDRVTTRHLEVVQIDQANNTILVKGAVPGKRGALVEVRG